MQPSSCFNIRVWCWEEAKGQMDTGGRHRETAARLITWSNRRTSLLLKTLIVKTSIIKLQDCKSSTVRRSCWAWTSWLHSDPVKVSTVGVPSNVTPALPTPLMIAKVTSLIEGVSQTRHEPQVCSRNAGKLLKLWHLHRRRVFKKLPWVWLQNKNSSRTNLKLLVALNSNCC